MSGSATDGEALRILLVSHLFPPETGGVQKVTEHLAVDSSHDITVLASLAEGDSEWDEQYSGAIHRHPLTGPRGLLTQLVLVFWLSLKADVVYYTRPEYTFFAAPARLLGRPVIAHAHGSELYANRSTLHELYLTLSRLTISHFVAISDWTRNRLVDLGVSESDITVIPNGVDFDHYHDPDTEYIDWDFDDETPVLVTVGRVVPRKGHHRVIQAISELDTDVEYLVIGPDDPSYLDELTELVETEGVSEQVHFLGKVPDEELLAYYALADAFIMPSKFVKGDVESFGLVYLEANAAGTPVIGARTGGVPTAIKDGETGLLCDPTPESVKKTIETLLSDEELRSELEENGVEWANEHDWKTIVSIWDQLISKQYTRN